MTIPIMAPPFDPHLPPMCVFVRVNGKEPTIYQLNPSAWTNIDLSTVPFQHSAVIHLRVDRPFSESPHGRILGIALASRYITRIE
jgi:hypothetical protein